MVMPESALFDNQAASYLGRLTLSASQVSRVFTVWHVSEYRNTAHTVALYK